MSNYHLERVCSTPPGLWRAETSFILCGTFLSIARQGGLIGIVKHHRRECIPDLLKHNFVDVLAIEAIVGRNLCNVEHAHPTVFLQKIVCDFVGGQFL